MPRPPTLSPNLRLERKLGEGAMGEVWQARSLSLDAPVAVKVLHQVDSPMLVARFEREAQQAARVASPHVVRIFDYGVSTDGLPFIVMELLRGCDLSQRLQAGPLSAADATTVMEQACRAVEAAHQIGVIHRDIKPANLFLVDVGGPVFVKLVDFGVAKQLQSDLDMTASGVLMGTPYYMSPEQLLSPRRIDHRSDLWSLAVVAYACLTGTVPFLGETLGALSVAIHEGRYVPVRSFRPDLSAAVDRWLERAFRRLPDERFQSATELAATFRTAVLEPSHSWAASGGPVLHTVPLSARHRPSPRRSKLRWAALALVAAGVTTGGIVLGLKLVPSAPRKKTAATTSSTATGTVRELPPPGLPRPPIDERGDDDDDDDPVLVPELKIRDASRFDLLLHLRDVEAWVHERDPQAKLSFVHAVGVRPDGTLDLVDIEHTAGFSFHYYSPAKLLCWSIVAIPTLGFHASLGKCDRKYTAAFPRCTIPQVLKRAYHDAIPPYSDFGFGGDVMGHHAWTVMNDDTRDEHSIADDC